MMNTVTLGMLSIYFAFLFGYFISVNKGFNNPVLAGMVSLAAFVLASMGNVAYFGDAKGLITAIIFGIVATEFFCWLSKIRALNIHLPSGVPPAVSKSFQVFLPALFTLGAVAILNIAVLAPALIDPNIGFTVEASNSVSVTLGSPGGDVGFYSIFHNGQT
jgi:PTS system cellobiose-specific IIC component